MGYKEAREQLAKQSIAEKVDHVRRAANLDPLHTCHWPGCTRRVKPALFTCRPHWFSIPIDIRNAIWRSYAPGQENTKTPSAAYLQAVRSFLDWHKRNYPDRTGATK